LPAEGEKISLSRLIKGSYPQLEPSSNEKKVISIRVFEQPKIDEDADITGSAAFLQAKEIVEKAKQEAEGILKKAQAEAEKASQQIVEEKKAFAMEKQLTEEEARKQGYAKGHSEGKDKGYQEYQQLIQSAQSVVHSAKKDYQMHVESADKEILQIGLKTAEKILVRKLEEEAESFVDIVKRALKEARDHLEVQLHIHPIHYDLLLENKEDLVRIFPKDVKFYIYPDDELPESSCIIESENGRIDASLDSQLKEIKQKLFDMLEDE
jgi:flagellar assembly protein FliH